MRALANFILRGRAQAVGVTSLFSLFALILPPAAYLLAGSPPALVTLRAGPAAGIQVALASFLVILLGLFLAGSPPVVVLALALAVWLPVIGCAFLLRVSESQAVLVQSAGGIAVGFVLAMYLIIGDVTDWWRGWLELLLTQGARQGPALAQFERVLPYLNGVVAATLVVNLTLAVMLARWWQSLLYYPGGFQREFEALHLPRALALFALLALGGAVLLRGGTDQILRDLFFVMLAMFLFQGLAALHRIAAQRGISRGWLLGMYLILLVLPQLLLFIACLGMADAWLHPPRRERPRDGDAEM